MARLRILMIVAACVLAACGEGSSTTESAGPVDAGEPAQALAFAEEQAANDVEPIAATVIEASTTTSTTSTTAAPTTTTAAPTTTTTTEAPEVEPTELTFHAFPEFNDEVSVDVFVREAVESSASTRLLADFGYELDDSSKFAVFEGEEIVGDTGVFQDLSVWIKTSDDTLISLHGFLGITDEWLADGQPIHAADAYFCQAWDECNGIDRDSLSVTGNKVASFDIVNTSDYPESSCILPTAGTIRVVDCNE